MQIIEKSPEDALGPLNEVEAKNAPKRLYLLGDESLLRHGSRVSIVGSRAASSDGLKRAFQLASILARNGVHVVSGLAAGIDTAAHRGSLEAGGRTIGVIGTPLDKSYPASNRELQTRIVADHLLVSQFPIGSVGGRKNFPMRNRTMALISDATVIVEAQEESGSLHQGWEALRLGRPLFLMESILTDGALKWPQEMLGYGAQILNREGIEHMLEYLPKGSRHEIAEFAF